MSTLKTDAIEAATGTNTDLSLDGKGTGVPDLATGFKVGGTAGLPINNLRVGTDGELITWDASGDPATVAVGTATHILTSNGAGAAPTFQAAAGGGAWTLIDSEAASSSASITLTGLDTSVYDVFALVLSNIEPSEDGRFLALTLGDASGLDTGASDYSWHETNLPQNGTTQSGRSSATDSVIRCTEECGNATGEGIGGAIIYIFAKAGASSGTYTMVRGAYTMINGSGVGGGGELVAYRAASLALTQLNVAMNSGNIDSGRVSVFGIKHT